jgi:probable rRNA maturation factor
MLTKAVFAPPGSKTISLNIDIDGDAWASQGITEEGYRRCCVEAFNEAQRHSKVDGVSFTACEVAILLTTDAKLQSLNLQFRGLDKPTNVLSFSALTTDFPPLMKGQPLFLGDIAIAAETVFREAYEQNKTVSDHLAHMIIHGTLHLLGYDHEDEEEAQEMEDLERKVLATQNIADPYLAMEQMP